MSRILAISRVLLLFVGVLGICVPIGQLDANNGISHNSNSESAEIQKEDGSSSSPDKLLKFSISVNKPEWRIGGAGSASDIGIVTLRIENSSDRDIELMGPGKFYLYNRFSKKARDQFYSSSALPGKTITWSTPDIQNVRRQSGIKCSKGEHLDLAIDLGVLKWGRVIGAEGPSQDIIEVVSSGKYELFFIFIVAKSNIVEIPKDTMFKSNKIDVVIK
jgi:hypothetical protein